MRIFVQYDETGKILGALATTLDNILVKGASGLGVHTLERDDLNGDELGQYLADLHNNFRIESTPSGHSTVVATHEEGTTK